MALPNHDRYRDYTDEQLETFLKAFPDHLDRPLVIRERELRSRIRNEVAENNPAPGQPRADEPPGRSGWFWVVAGVTVIIGIIAAFFWGTRLSSVRHPTSPTSAASATASPRTVPDDVLSMPSPTEEKPLAELLASPTPSPAAASG